jgi:hypothetical protein
VHRNRAGSGHAEACPTLRFARSGAWARPSSRRCVGSIAGR